MVFILIFAEQIVCMASIFANFCCDLLSYFMRHADFLNVIAVKIILNCTFLIALLLCGISCKIDSGYTMPI